MVFIHLPDGTTTATGPGTVEEILDRLDLNPYEILITRNGELLLPDEPVENADTLTATSIVHGG